jgi:glutathione synthase
MITPRQTTNHTCGPAALLAAASLSGAPLNLSDTELALQLSSNPTSGTANALMVEFATKHLPVASMGAENWNGGLAIANILNPDSGSGHYVVLLSETDGVITYYDPYGNVVSIPRKDLHWRSGVEQHINWSINLAAPSPDARNIVPARHTFILADDKSTLMPEFDTSLLIEAETLARGQSCTWNLVTGIATEGKRLFLDGVPVWDGDIVWIRPDPVNTVQYYELQRHLLGLPGVFLNTPEAILNCHDKHMVAEFRKDRFTVSSQAGMAAIWRKMRWRGHERIVIKAPSRFGGHSIAFASSESEANEQAQLLLPDSGYVIVEPFVPEPGRPHVDTRVMVCNGEVIGVVDRVAKECGLLSNLHQGATARANSGLSKTQAALLDKAMEKIAEHGVFLAGIDFLEDEITEINISCPSAARQINQVTGMKVENTLVEMANQVADEKMKRLL